MAKINIGPYNDEEMTEEEKSKYLVEASEVSKPKTETKTSKKK
jgi:hypothetical protein